MAGLIAYAASGALAGAGEGLAAQGKRQFEAMLEELRNKRQVARDEANRQFQTSEREATQEFRSGETAADRDWRSGEADRDAGRQTDRFQDSEGNWWVRSKDGATAERVRGKDGKPIAGPSKATGKSKFVNIHDPKDPTQRATVQVGSPGFQRRVDQGWLLGDPETPGYRSRTRNIDGNMAVFEESKDDGRTWRQVGNPYARDTDPLRALMTQALAGRAGGTPPVPASPAPAATSPASPAPTSGNASGAGESDPSASESPVLAAAKAAIAAGRPKDEIAKALRSRGLDPAALPELRGY